MSVSKFALVLPLLLIGVAAPAAAGPVDAAAQPVDACMAPEAFLTALVTAGDWIVKRDLDKVGENRLNGVVFRESGMIDVALFKEGCLAMVVVVGKAPPDIEV